MTPTNPPSVPAIDVEACARLLTELAPRFDDPDDPLYEANVFGKPRRRRALLLALTSALPGMAKDSERLDWLNGRLNWFTTQGPGHDPQYRDIRERIDAAQTMTPEYLAAQPEETSADAECEDGCERCSGEYCERHGTDPCDCDVIDRHTSTEPTP